MTRRTVVTAFAAACLSVAGAACSSAAPKQALPANPDLTVLAPGGLKFDKTEYAAKAGEVKVAFVSKDTLVHDLVIEDANKVKIGTKLKVGPGESAGATFTLTAGTYSVYCDIAGHRQSMNAKLVVS